MFILIKFALRDCDTGKFSFNSMMIYKSFIDDLFPIADDGVRNGTFIF